MKTSEEKERKRRFSKSQNDFAQSFAILGYFFEYAFQTTRNLPYRSTWSRNPLKRSENTRSFRVPPNFVCANDEAKSFFFSSSSSSTLPLHFHAMRPPPVIIPHSSSYSQSNPSTSSNSNLTLTLTVRHLPTDTWTTLTSVPTECRAIDLKRLAMETFEGHRSRSDSKSPSRRRGKASSSREDSQEEKENVISASKGKETKMSGDSLLSVAGSEREKKSGGVRRFTNALRDRVSLILTTGRASQERKLILASVSFSLRLVKFARPQRYL